MQPCDRVLQPSQRVTTQILGTTAVVLGVLRTDIMPILFPPCEINKLS